MTVPPIGMLRMVDQGREDEKILAVGTNNPLLEIEQFFTVYKELETKTTRITGWNDAAEAREIVRECNARFAKKN